MRFATITSTLLLAVTGMGNAAAISPNENANSDSILMKRDYFDCNGSGMCGGAVNFVRDCDIAVNSVLIRNDVLNYGASG